MPGPNRAGATLHARIAFGLWLAAIVAATVPWTDFVGHAHWQKVQWIPFVSPPVSLVDIVVNILLYVPFGYGCIRASAFRGRAWHAVAMAALLSLAIESSQLYSHSRFPSLQDIVCNVAGAWLGAIWAGRQ